MVHNFFRQAPFSLWLGTLTTILVKKKFINCKTWASTNHHRQNRIYSRKTTHSNTRSYCQNSKTSGQFNSWNKKSGFQMQNQSVDPISKFWHEFCSKIRIRPVGCYFLLCLMYYIEFQIRSEHLIKRKDEWWKLQISTCEHHWIPFKNQGFF